MKIKIFLLSLLMVNVLCLALKGSESTGNITFTPDNKIILVSMGDNQALAYLKANGTWESDGILIDLGRLSMPPVAHPILLPIDSLLEEDLFVESASSSSSSIK